MPILKSNNFVYFKHTLTFIIALSSNRGAWSKQACSLFHHNSLFQQNKYQLSGIRHTCTGKYILGKQIHVLNTCVLKSKCIQNKQLKIFLSLLIPI